MGDSLFLQRNLILNWSGKIEWCINKMNQFFCEYDELAYLDYGHCLLVSIKLQRIKMSFGILLQSRREIGPDCNTGFILRSQLQRNNITLPFITQDTKCDGILESNLNLTAQRTPP